jgi:hypothetical protein
MAEQRYRLGGHYRQNDGRLVRLDPVPFGVNPSEFLDQKARQSALDGMAYATTMEGGQPRRNQGHRSLVTGCYPGYETNAGYTSHLTPGECDAWGEGLPGVKQLKSVTRDWVGSQKFKVPATADFVDGAFTVFLGTFRSPVNEVEYDCFYSPTQDKVCAVNPNGVSFVAARENAHGAEGIMRLAAKQADSFRAVAVKHEVSEPNKAKVPWKDPKVVQAAAPKVHPKDEAMLKRDAAAKPRTGPKVADPVAPPPRVFPASNFVSPDMKRSDHRTAPEYGTAHR